MTLRTSIQSRVSRRHLWCVRHLGAKQHHQALHRRLWILLFEIYPNQGARPIQGVEHGVLGTAVGIRAQMVIRDLAQYRAELVSIIVNPDLDGEAGYRVLRVGGRWAAAVFSTYYCHPFVTIIPRA